MVNPEAFPFVKVGDLLDIYPPQRPDEKRLVLRVEKLEEQKGSLQISIAKAIASEFQLFSHQEVVIEAADPKNVGLDFVHVHFKDQYLSRSDIWRMQQALTNKCVYVSQRLSILGYRAKVSKLLINGRTIGCGLVRPFTKFVFRSRSARIIWCFQMSKEMFACANDAELYYEKAIHRFSKECFERWQKLDAHHSLTVVFFGRTYYHTNTTQKPSAFIGQLISGKRRNSINVSSDGRIYEDVFQTVVENECLSDWSSLIIRLKRAVLTFASVANWKCPSLPKDNSEDNSASTGGSSVPPSKPETAHAKQLDGKELVGLPSSAASGNVLEALNLTLNVFEKHHMDRDLARTGQSVVLITAGTGVFRVDRHLVLLTKRRLVNNGVGIDLISLTTRPFHTVPLLLFNPELDSERIARNDDNKMFYNIPHWLRICFPFDPSPLHDKFAALPAYRMIELLPGSVSSRGASVDTYNVNNAYDDLPHALRVILTSNATESLKRGKPGFEEANARISSPRKGSPVKGPKQFNNGNLESTANSNSSDDDDELEFKTITIPASPRTSSLSTALNGGPPSDQLGLQRVESRENLAEKAWQLRAHGVMPRPISMGGLMRSGSNSSASSALLPMHSSNSTDTITLRNREDYNGHDMSLFNSSSMYSSSQSIGSRSFSLPPSSDSKAKPSSRDRKKSERSIYRRSTSHNPNPSSGIMSSLSEKHDKSGGRQRQRRPFQGVRGMVASQSTLGLSTLAKEIPAKRTAGQVHLDKSTTGNIVLSSSYDSKSYMRRNPRFSQELKTGAIDVPTKGAVYDTFRPQLEGKPPMKLKHVWTSTTQTSSPRKMLLHRRQNNPLLPGMSEVGEFEVYGTSPAEGRGAFSSVGSPPSSEGSERLSMSPKQSISPKRSISPKPGSTPPRSPRRFSHGGMSSFNRRSVRFAKKNNMLHPFNRKYQKDQKLLEKFTISRRRWRHIYAKAFDAMRGSGHLADDTFSIDWLSLCQPAILPITTDYYPKEHKDSEKYNTSNYTVSIDPTSESSHEELIIEMVCQRLQQEFQIVVASDGAVETSEKGLKYTLSLGHTIHKLSLDSQLNNIFIEIFKHKYKDDAAEVSKLGYHFSLWEPAVNDIASHHQEFERATPTNWNYLDQVVSGYFSDLPSSIRDRRVRFVLCPLALDSKLRESGNGTQEHKGVDASMCVPWLNPQSALNKSDDQLRSEFMQRQDATGAMEQERIDKFNELCAWLEKNAGEDSDPFEVEVVRMPGIDTDSGALLTPTLPAEPGTSRRRRRRPDSRTIKINLKGGSVGRNEWILLEYDSLFYPERYFHLSIHFVVCAGKTVSTFIKSIYRQMRRLSLEMFQVPEYTHPRQPPYLHPFSQPLLIPLPLRKQMRLNLLIQDALLTRFEFLIESDVVTRRGPSSQSYVVDEPMGFILGCSTLQLDVFRIHHLGNRAALPNVQNAQSGHRRGWGGRQYLHKSGDVFLRIVEDGILWIPNRLVERRESWVRADSQFMEFKQFCEATRFAYSEVRSIISTAHLEATKKGAPIDE